MIVSTIKENMQRTISLLLAITFYFIHQNNSLPTNKFNSKVLKDACNHHCTDNTCFSPYPDACYQYIQCHKFRGDKEYSQTYLMTCALGLVWDVQTTACLPKERSTEKCQDKCLLDETLKSYRNGPFCAQYYMCVNGSSEPMCCRRGEAFIDGQCVADAQCNGECPVKYAPIETTTFSNENITTLAPETTTELCEKSAVPENPEEYIYTNIDTKAVCARGTVFDQSSCGCVFDPTYVPSTECFPEIVINYAAAKTVGSMNEDNNVQKFNGAGRFVSNKRSSSEINHYKGNDNLLIHFNMTIIFKAESTGDKIQYLVTNCRSTEVDRPSIGILVSNIDGTLLFVADNNSTAAYDSIIKMTLAFKKGAWNWVRYIFDGRTLQATVIPLPDRLADPSTGTEVYTKNVTLAISSEDPVALIPSQNPLTFGYCSNNDGFDGLIYLANLAPWVCSMYMDSLNGP